MRDRLFGDVHPWDRRMLLLRKPSGLRTASIVHGRGRIGGVHVQHRFRLPKHGRHHLHEHDGLCDLLHRSRTMHLPIRVCDLHEPDMRFGHRLHGGLRPRSNDLPRQCTPELRNERPMASQRGVLRRNAILRRGRVRRGATELRAGRPRNE